MNLRGEMRIVVAGGGTGPVVAMLESIGLKSRVVGAAGTHTAEKVDSSSNGDGASRRLLAATGDEPLLDAEAWRTPHFAWIRADGLNGGALAALLARAERHDLFCSLPTATATELNIAGRLAVAIGDRHSISDATREDLELALHEAISNGLVHGNLGVASIKGLTIDDLDHYSRDITDRLADPSLSERRIEVSALLDDTGVTVDVCDQGAGYDAAADRDADGACGRGLELISAIATSCEVLDGGRRITMRFSL